MSIVTKTGSTPREEVVTAVIMTIEIIETIEEITEGIGTNVEAVEAEDTRETVVMMTEDMTDVTTEAGITKEDIGIRIEITTRRMVTKKDKVVATTNAKEEVIGKIMMMIIEKADRRAATEEER